MTASRYPDTAVLSGMLGMSRDRTDRLATLKFVMGRDPSGRTHAELVRIFCRVELHLTADKIEAYKHKSAKLRHLRAAIEVMIEAGATERAPEILTAARALLDRIENPPPPGPVDIDPQRRHITIDEQDVILLETTARLDMSSLQDIVFGALWSARAQRRHGAQWLAFGDSDRLHVTGMSTWIGLSRSLPLAVVDAIQAAFEAEGLEVEREMGRALHLDLSPFARLSEDGLEILVPAALAGDPTRKRIVERGTTRPFARGYYVKPPRRSLL